MGRVGGGTGACKAERTGGSDECRLTGGRALADRRLPACPSSPPALTHNHSPAQHHRFVYWAHASQERTQPVKVHNKLFVCNYYYTCICDSIQV